MNHPTYVSIYIDMRRGRKEGREATVRTKPETMKNVGDRNLNPCNRRKGNTKSCNYEKTSGMTKGFS